MDFEQIYKSSVSLICKYLALWRRIMCPLMFPFSFALYLQKIHLNCGSLPHSNFKWFISDVLNWYVRPQSGHTSILSREVFLLWRLDAFPDFGLRPASGSHTGSPYSKSLAKWRFIIFRRFRPIHSRNEKLINYRISIVYRIFHNKQTNGKANDSTI